MYKRVCALTPAGICASVFRVTAPRADRPSWSSLRDVPRVVLWPPHLKKTLLVALVVGTVLFTINQLDVVLAHRATPFVWMKIALTYCVPFAVSNYGVLIGTRRGVGL